jgi:hypothetical protein
MLAALSIQSPFVMRGHGSSDIREQRTRIHAASGSRSSRISRLKP